MPICYMRGEEAQQREKTERVHNGRGRGCTIAATGAVVYVVDVERVVGVVCSDDTWVKTRACD
jgi:hypothetical protein